MNILNQTSKSIRKPSLIVPHMCLSDGNAALTIMWNGM